MTLRPRRAPGPVVARLLPAALLASGALLSAGPASRSPATGAAHPVPAAAAQPAAEAVRVLVDRIDPRVATPRTPVRVAGRLVAADRPVGDLVVRLHLGPRVTSRGGLRELRERPATIWTSVRRQPVSDRLDPGGSARFTLVEPLAGLGLPAELGVYPMQVTVTGTVDGAGRLLGRADTFLVYAPAKVEQPTPVGWVLPLTDRPRLGPTGALSDDTLAAALGPGGRLSTLLAAARASGGRGTPPVTLAVDPALVEAVQVMAAGPYTVALAGGGRTVRPRSADAADFLARLRAFARAGGVVVALPYGDVDVTALVHAGFPSEVERARQKGGALLRDLLGPDPAAGRVAYPPAGRLDRDTLERLAADGVDTVVLDAAALPSDASLPFTQTAVSRLATTRGSVRALVADDELGRLVRTPPPSATTPRLVEQALDAETAMITAERPGEARAVLLALPRDWDPPASVGSFVLARLSSVPWVRPAALPALLAAAPQGRGELVHPAEARAAE
ncbi:MAG TPA: DUF6049 family protein, partial [Frankiaceae bacterium]|nr:DUF6049 family protein [Frankiaceae bacterium]